MGKGKSPERIQAEQMYLESGGKMLLVDIAAALGKSDSLIRKWKNNDEWDVKLNGNVTESKGNVTDKSSGNVTKSEPEEKGGAPPEKKRKKGPPDGNQNAKGHGAPKGNKNAKGNPGGGAPEQNKNAVTTGEYETIWMDVLDEDERLMFNAVETDQIKQLDGQIKLFEIRERRMLKRISELQKSGEEMVVSTEDEGEQDSDSFGKTTSKSKRYEAAIDRIQRIEEALTRVQDKKAKAIAEKDRILRERERLEIERKKLELAEAKLDLETYKALPPQDEDAELTESDGYNEAMGGMTAQEVWSDDDPATES